MPTPEPLNLIQAEVLAWSTGDSPLQRMTLKLIAEVRALRARMKAREKAEAQPEVADLRKRALAIESNRDRYGDPAYMSLWAADLRSHARTLVALAEARETIARVEETLGNWRETPLVEGPFRSGVGWCADELTAALSAPAAQADARPAPVAADPALVERMRRGDAAAFREYRALG